MTNATGSDDRPRRAALSPAGAERRDAMLAELTATMTRLHRARRARRRVFAAALLLVGAIGATIVATVPERAERGAAEHVARGGDTAGPAAPGAAPTVAGDPVRGTAEAAPDRGGPAAPGPSIAIVRTRPGIVDRYAAGPVAPRVEAIGDDALLEALASIGHDTGLIRASGVVRLSRPVVASAPDAGTSPSRRPS